MAIPLGCILPHPPIIIPEIGGDDTRLVLKTIDGLERLADRVAETAPEAAVVISPHSTGFYDSIAVKTSPLLAGSFASFGFPKVSMEASNDLELAGAVAEEASVAGIPIVEIGESRARPTRKEELDHGVLVPLYYIFKKVELPLVSLSISYLDYSIHYDLGKAVRRAADGLGRRVVFIASGDLSHRLLPGSPAGYDERAKEYDARIVDLVGAADFEGIMRLDADLIERAGECGFRSIIALAGAFDGVSVRTEILSYEGPFGVGYMVATVEPDEPEESDSRP